MPRHVWFSELIPGSCLKQQACLVLLPTDPSRHNWWEIRSPTMFQLGCLRVRPSCG